MPTVDDEATSPLIPDPSPPATVSVGALVGRYVLLGEIGAGGGGRVFVAFDPVLERKVAVKVLRTSSHGHSALLREARILAKMAHPQVVSIHDVGMEGEQPFMAMELMEGSDFLEFAASAPRRALLQSLTAVADAVSCAHEAGLIHGDIKPSNILRSKSGQTKLSDFGVARSWTREQANSRTRLVGTPAYMAPELFDGAPSSPAADQYAFCLTAWVAFHGRYPWPRHDTVTPVSQELESPTRQDINPTEHADPVLRPAVGWTAPGLQSSVTRALLRGLEADPDARWPDMGSLLAVLRAAPRRRRRRALFVGVGLAAGAATTALAGSMSDQRPCARASDPIETAWDDEIRQQVRDQLGGHAAYAQATKRVDGKLDSFARRWAEMSEEACEATVVLQTQSVELLDQRSTCLRDALSAFNATVETLTQGEDDVRAVAHDLATQLPDLQRCADAERLRDKTPLPSDPVRRETIHETRAALGRVSAQRTAGHYEAAGELLDQWESRLDDADFEPLRVEFEYQRALTALARSDFERADVSARAALERTWAIDDLDTALDLAVVLTTLHGIELEHYERAQTYRDLARGLAGRPGVSATSHASVLNAAGNAMLAEGRYREGVELQQRAVQGYEAEGANDEFLTSLRNDLAVALHFAGDLDLAIAVHRRALDLRRKLLGDRHPVAAQSLDNLSQVHYDRGDYAEAERLSREALSIRRVALPADHVDVGRNTNGLANILATTGHGEEAIELYRDALRILGLRLGPSHPTTAVTESSLGIVLTNVGRHDEGLAILRDSLRREAERRGDEHPATVLSRSNLGAVLIDLERYDEAIETLQPTVELAADTWGWTHDHTLAAGYNLASAFAQQQRWEDALDITGKILARLDDGETCPAVDEWKIRYIASVANRETGRTALALEQLRANLALSRREDIGPLYRGKNELGLVRLLWDEGTQEGRTEAREFAQRAVQSFGSAGRKDRQAEVTDWLAKH